MSAASLIVCVGDIALDEMVSVPALPSPGGKTDGRLIGRFPGGMATNTAVALARLGVPTRLVAASGDDAAGTKIRTALEGHGIDIAPVAVLPQTATFRCFVMIDSAGEKALVRLPSPAYLPPPAAITPQILAGARHVHVTLGDAALTAAVMAAAAQVGAAVSLDVEAPDVALAGDALGAVMAGASIVFANRAATDALSAALGPAALAAVPEVVTTKGAAGVDVRMGARRAAVRGHPVSVVDSTGAGDCFAAAYLARRLEGADPLAAARFAAVAAALALTAYGAQTAMPTRDAVVRAMAQVAL